VHTRKINRTLSSVEALPLSGNLPLEVDAFDDDLDISLDTQDPR